MQCRAPAGGWRRPAPSEKTGGGSSAGRGRELPVRRRGRGRPPRVVASCRRRRPARLLPAAQSASSEASAGGRGGRGGGARARCLPGGGARGRSAGASCSRARSPRLRSPGGRTRPPARGRDKERGGDPAGWPLPPLAAEPVPGRAGARAPSRGAAVPRGVASGLSPPPERGCPLGYPPRRLGQGAFGAGGRSEVILGPGHIPSAGAGAPGDPGPVPNLSKDPGRVVGSSPLP